MQAKASFQEAMFLDPYWSYPRFNLALTYQLTGREDARARAAYDEAIRFAQFYGMNSGYLLHDLGVFLERRQEWDKAADAFNSAVRDLLQSRIYLDRIAPHNASPATTREWMLRRAALGRSAGEAYNSLGSLYAVQGFTARARTAFHQALDLQPDLDSAARNLGQLLLNASRKLRATSCCPKLAHLSASDQERLLIALGRTEYHGDRTDASSEPNNQTEEDKKLVDTCPGLRPVLEQFSHSNIARKAAAP
jgi:Tfp pilus assembly protein PilF